jgi:hypothetical protein
MSNSLPSDPIDESHQEYLRIAYPLLCALCWQGTSASTTHLSESEIIQIYERGWRWRGVLAEPTEGELAFIRKLAERHQSWLINYV